MEVGTLSFSSNQARKYLCEPVASITINLFLNLGIVTVLSAFWLLNKQAIQVSTRAPEARGLVSVFVPPGKISLRGPGSNKDAWSIADCGSRPNKYGHEASFRGLQLGDTFAITIAPKPCRVRLWRSMNSFSQELDRGKRTVTCFKAAVFVQGSSEEPIY